MMHNPEQNPADIEKLLKNLPKYEMRKAKELQFYAKLMKLARQKKQALREERYQARGVFSSFSIFRSFAFASAAVIILFTATVGFALSPNVTEGDLLYPVKKWEERFELTLSDDPAVRVERHMRFAGRRLSELKTLLKDDPEFLRQVLIPTAKAAALSANFNDLSPEVQATIEAYYDETSKASEEASKIKEVKKAEKVLRIVIEAQEKHVEKFESMIPLAPEKVKPVLAEALTAVEKHQALAVEKKVEISRLFKAKTEEVVLQMIPLREVVQEIRAQGEISEAKLEKRKEIAAQTLENAKAKLETLKQKIAADPGVRTEELEAFKKFVEEKLSEAEEALKKEKYGTVHGLSNATDAMIKKFQLYKEFKSEEEARKHSEEKKRIFEKEMTDGETEFFKDFEKFREKTEAAYPYDTQKIKPQITTPQVTTPQVTTKQTYPKTGAGYKEGFYDADEKKRLLELIDEKIRSLKIEYPSADYQHKDVEDLRNMLRYLEGYEKTSGTGTGFLEDGGSIGSAGSTGPGFREEWLQADLIETEEDFKASTGPGF